MQGIKILVLPPQDNIHYWQQAWSTQAAVHAAKLFPASIASDGKWKTIENFLVKRKLDVKVDIQFLTDMLVFYA